MASLTDLLTAAKNGVAAINGLAQTYLTIQGTQSANALTVATLVKSGVGRLASISVVHKGTAVGYIYDANSAAATTDAMYVIPITEGVYILNFPVSNGIVVAPGSGQIVSISYS